MAAELGYQRQVAPRPAAAMPAPSPEAFGAGLGAQLQDTAEVAHREGLQSYQVQRQAAADAERTTKFQQLAAWKANVSQQRDQLRATAAPGAAGHLEAVGQLVSDDATAPLLDGVKENSTRQWLQQQLASFKGDLLSSEDLFATGQAIDKTLADAQDGVDTLANNAATSSDPKAWPDAHRQALSYIAGLTIDGNAKDKLARYAGRTIDLAKGRQLADSDPQQLVALLDHGVFDDSLKPEDVAALRDRATVEIHSQAVEAHRVATEQKAQVLGQVHTLEEADRQGISLPDSQYAAAAQAAATSGDPTLALHIDGLRANAGFAKAWQPATPVQRDAREAELAAKAKRTPAEDRELKWLQDKGPALDSRFNADPAGFYAAQGEALPPLTDPAGRAQWARERSVAAGRPVPPLTHNEAADLQANFRSGRPGAIQVLDLIGAMPSDQAAAAARQIDPNDATIGVLATLPRAFRQLALDGRDALKAKPQLVSVKALEKARDPAADVIHGYDQHFSEALIAAPPAQRNAILAVAARIVAGGMDQDGASELTPERYWMGLNMALGGRRQSDGQWVGGLGQWGEHWFALPDGVTGTAFGAAVQRAAVSGGHKPVNPDGSPAVLRNAFPVAIGHGLFEFRSAGGAVVKGSDGLPWRVTVKAAGQ